MADGVVNVRQEFDYIVVGAGSARCTTTQSPCRE
jgi:hypothetical protein